MVTDADYAREFIDARLSVEGRFSVSLGGRFDDAVRELIRIAYSHGLDGRSFFFGATPTIEAEYDAVIRALLEGVEEDILDLGFILDDEGSDEDHLAWLEGLHEDEYDLSFEGLLMFYVGLFGKEYESLIAACLLLGYGEEEAFDALSSIRKDPWHSDLWKDALILAGTGAVMAEVLRDGGVSFGKGKSNVSYTLIDTFGRGAITEGWMDWWKENEGSDYFRSMTADSTACSECKSEEGKGWQRIEAYPSGAWHPNCYHKDAEVLTDGGWKLFAEVADTDKILSLNPDTRGIEWVGIVDRQCYDYKGVLLRFSNNSLECIVTPEHSMVYISKKNGELLRCSAQEFAMSRGFFYRNCEYSGKDVLDIVIGDKTYSFDDFCEFMGYYLSDGSSVRNSNVSISQQDGEKAKPIIVECLERMGLHPCISPEKVNVYNSALARYCAKFGKCTDKYVPEVIKNASSRQIDIFLNAYVKCDGYVVPERRIKGNKGGEGKSVPTRQFFTTSKQMSADLGECLLKVGKHPSFWIQHPTNAVKKDGTEICGNYDVHIINERTSSCASTFKKEAVEYNDKVYDLTLSKNHIMYIRQNGKCFWGSNCRCTFIFADAEDVEVN